MREEHLYLGPPGTGKTTKLISLVEEALEAGIPPERIAYFSFSRAGAYEARDRAIEKFKLPAKRFPFFRTIHSMCFRCVGQDRMVMTTRDYRRLGGLLNLQFFGVYEDVDVVASGTGEGDRIKFLEQQCRIRKQTPNEVMRQTGIDVNVHRFRRYVATLEQYKQEHEMIDFTDMLSLYIENGTALDVDVFILDEAQDQSSLQWDVTKKAAGNASKVFIAGDDDQAIHAWAGADVDQFIDLRMHSTVLDHSYRLPRAQFALAEKVARRIHHRFEKTWAPRDEDGIIRHVREHGDIPLQEGDWLLLARNHSGLGAWEEAARDAGRLYNVNGKASGALKHADAIVAWERLRKGREVQLLEVRKVYALLMVDKHVKRGHKGLKHAEESLTLEMLKDHHGLLVDGPWFEVMEKIDTADRTYLQKCLRHGEKITEPPQVNISTIHGAKGKEATNVGLATGMAWATWKEYMEGADTDSEHRVWYVGVTRSKHGLFIVDADERGYQL